MIVYNAEPFGYSEKARQIWLDKACVYQEGSWDEIAQSEVFEEVTILIVRLKRMIDGEVLQKFPKLKKLLSATTGHDHIDEAALKERGVELVSLRGHDEFLKTIPSTAEHTWALIMALLRNIPKANAHVRDGLWDRDLFRGHQLQDKTLGLVGYGRTGQKVAQYARSFGMHVSYFDPFVASTQDAGEKSLEALFAKSDILSFHVHLKTDTIEMLNQKNISAVKKDAYLINTSRGKIWEENAVKEALLCGHVAGVAVDVLANELNDSKKSPLYQAQADGLNVIITPHIAGATWDAMWATEQFIAKKTLENTAR
jgi:D-3-phosphoglycerate dehydrogenase